MMSEFKCEKNVFQWRPIETGSVLRFPIVLEFKIEIICLISFF